MAVNAQAGGGTLVIHRGALGDLVGAVPSLRALRQAFPAGPFMLLAQPASGRLLQRCGVVDAALDVNAGAWLPLFGGTDVSAELRAHLAAFARCVAWIADPDGDTAAGLRACGVQEVLVAPPLGPAAGVPHARHLAAGLEEWKIAVADSVPALTPHVHDLRNADEWIAGWRQTERGPVLAVHPGSGSLQKNWPPEAFREVIHRFRRTWAGQVLVCLGPAEVERGPGRAEWDDLVDAVVEVPPLVELAAVVSRCAAYLGNDAGTTHLAAAVGTPTVALFGAASDPAIWTPAGRHAEVVSVSCRPDARAEPGDVDAVCDALGRALRAGGYNPAPEKD